MADLFSISDKTFALSGGTGTLGGSIAEYLVNQGARVILLGRSPKKLRDKKNELDKIKDGHTSIYEVDVLKEEALMEVNATIVTYFE